MTPQRKTILKSYSAWTVLSALRSGAPIKSKDDVYPLISQINFTNILDTKNGKITKDEFEKWHKNTLEYLVCENSKLKNQYGWAAKMINIYLKTYCYIGDGGRDGILPLLHPPVDSGLWSGIRKRFEGDYTILKDSHVVTKIKDISTHATYLQVIAGMRLAAKKMQCPLIEVEQLWEGAGDA